MRVVSAMLGGLAIESAPLPLLMLLAEPFICWISYVIFSVFMVSRMLVVAVGRRARTVKVQSSWFCSKRRRRLRTKSAQSVVVRTWRIAKWASHLGFGNGDE